MPRILTDLEIKRLLEEPKKLPTKWHARLTPTYREDSVQCRRQWDCEGDKGSKFRVHVRDNRRIVLDFSIILIYVDEDGTDYILTRFNGRHPSQHTNIYEKRHNLEGQSFRNQFHIHVATERYQISGLRIEGFAKTTTKYFSFESALEQFISSNGFYVDGISESRPLFGDDDYDE